MAEDFNAVFIRAPYIERVGEGVNILATYDDAIVAAEEGPFLCTAFHPELTEDHRLAHYFVEKVKESKKDLQDC